MAQALSSVAGGGQPAGVVSAPAMDADTDREFAEFVRDRLSALVRFGCVLTGDGTAGEDLAQEALVKTYPKFSRLQGDAYAYVRRAMVNTHHSRWRLRRREAPAERVPDAPVPDATSDVALEQVLWHAMARLPARRRTALVLRFYEDMSITEVAETMRCREGTAKSLVSRGLSSLRADPEVTDRDLVETGIEHDDPHEADR